MNSIYLEVGLFISFAPPKPILHPSKYPPQTSRETLSNWAPPFCSLSVCLDSLFGCQMVMHTFAGVSEPDGVDDEFAHQAGHIRCVNDAVSAMHVIEVAARELADSVVDSEGDVACWADALFGKR